MWSMSAVEVGAVEIVEERSEDAEQSMEQSADCTAGNLSTVPVRYSALSLTPRRRASATDATPQVTVTMPSNADAHDGDQKRQYIYIYIYIYIRCNHCQFGYS